MARNNYGVNFGGKRIVHPGAYDSIDANALAAVVEGGLNLPIVVGTSDAGAQGKPKYFTDLSSAREYLRGGDILTALELMFSPSADGGGGSSMIGVLPVNPTVQATLLLGGLAQNSIEYGNGGNRIQTKLENGTISGTKRYTVYKWDENKTEVFDNLGAVIQIQYTGIQLYAVVTITVASGIATSLQTKIGSDSGSSQTDLSLDLTNDRYKTVDDVVSYINGVSDYTAKIINIKSSGLASSSLDTASTANILTPYRITSVKGDFEQQVNNNSLMVGVSVTSTLTNFPFTYLTGGDKGATPSSWATYFDVLKKEFSDMLVVLSSDASIHAEALSHVGQMINRNQKQMLFTGGDTGETVDEAKQRASGLNSSRAVIGYPSIKSGISSVPFLPAYFTGALLAGRVAGVPTTDPITFDYVSVLELENNLVAGDPDIDDLITSGVCTLERVQGGGIRIVQGVTTYLGGNNVLYREISSRRGADVLSETMRKTLEDAFVGRRALKATPSAVTTKAIDVLEKAKRDDDIIEYRNISVRFISGAIYLDYEVAQAEPINFVLVTTHFVPTIL